MLFFIILTLYHKNKNHIAAYWLQAVPLITWFIVMVILIFFVERPVYEG